MKSSNHNLKPFSILRIILFACFGFLNLPSVFAQAVLPPFMEWHGKSEQLIADQDNPWITPAEQSGFGRTPDYQQTMTWLARLCEASPLLKMISIGKSANGRDIFMVIASGEQAWDQKALAASAKPLLLAQAGIHAGEIDGKDAGMMLLRDIAFGNKKNLLKEVNLLFIPILNVDGHERSSPYGRINQRGPESMGWRTNAQNLNLNRDYTKLDTKEISAVVQVINAYQPDLYMDIHVTDGADYQYDITYGFTGPHGYSPSIATWLGTRFRPAIDQGLRKMGHIPGPLLFSYNNLNFDEGNVVETFSPRFSHAYGDLRHLPTILVENHSLKPYQQRVLGTYVLLENTLQLLAKEGKTLKKAIKDDQALRKEAIPLSWKFTETPPDTMPFLGIASQLVESKVTGAQYVQWLGKPVTQKVINLRQNQPAETVQRPQAYWVPAAWDKVIQRLKLHGIQMEEITKPREVKVEMYRINDYALDEQPFEGHVRVNGQAVKEIRKETYAPGSIRISTDQPLGDLVILLLEPDSPDSFFQWGFFLEILSRTEYAEPYVMEPMAQRMLEQDPSLKKEFEKKLREDENFAKDPGAKLQWFYQRTPYFDERWQLYPVGREL